MEDIYLDTITMSKLQQIGRNSYSIKSNGLAADVPVDSLIVYFERCGYQELGVYAHTFQEDGESAGQAAICLKLPDGVFTELNSVSDINAQSRQLSVSMPAPMIF